jgi:hypothetical protein
VITVRVGEQQDAARLVDACLIAAGEHPLPTDPDETKAFRNLADQLGDGLDALPGVVP